MPEQTFAPPVGRGQSGEHPEVSPADPRRYRPNPYAAETPRGYKPSYPGHPGAPTARIPTGPYDDPVDSHPGPVGPPAVPVWQATSSSEFFRRATEHPYAPNPQGASPEQMIGQVRGASQKAPDPKWIPSAVIRTLWPPSASQLTGRPFDQLKTHRLSGAHGSMAGRKRSYQLIPGERPVHHLTTTYRIVPPSKDEVTAAQLAQPTIQPVLIPDRSQNGSWRLF